MHQKISNYFGWLIIFFNGSYNICDYLWSTCTGKIRYFFFFFKRRLHSTKNTRYVRICILKAGWVKFVWVDFSKFDNKWINEFFQTLPLSSCKPLNLTKQRIPMCLHVIWVGQDFDHSYYYHFFLLKLLVLYFILRYFKIVMSLK